MTKINETIETVPVKKTYKLECDYFKFLEGLFDYISKTKCDIVGDMIILDTKFSDIINKSGLHFGRGGSHIWFSKKSNNERVSIIYYLS